MSRYAAVLKPGYVVVGLFRNYKEAGSAAIKAAYADRTGPLDWRVIDTTKPIPPYF